MTVSLVITRETTVVLVLEILLPPPLNRNFSFELGGSALKMVGTPLPVLPKI
jgi:hypothetical protein